MLCTQATAFHIQLIRSHWYNKTCNDPAKEPFLVAQKFEMEESMMMGWNGSALYLNVLNQGAMFEAENINRKTIDERKLYGEAWGKARAALMVAVQRHDYNFIAILDKYLNDYQEQLSFDSDSEVTSNGTSDSEIEGNLNPEELMNSHKYKSKGQPKGTNRIRCTDELLKKAKCKLQCKICGHSGHNRVTCSQRQK
ncbi:hypothetical protein C2G38_2038278 [Gigaspora rosea]|uniref:CCHC-type domain-containing protein n=1 Tax=Gigaspora rosea TaxID=44941 RepID=A0A397V578_9GLOM|nr:hypothetical protein C2G38_2038278 [Gigaspora rosea]